MDELRFPDDFPELSSLGARLQRGSDGGAAVLRFDNARNERVQRLLRATQSAMQEQSTAWI